MSPELSCSSVVVVVDVADVAVAVDGEGTVAKRFLGKRDSGRGEGSSDGEETHVVCEVWRRK